MKSWLVLLAAVMAVVACTSAETTTTTPTLPIESTSSTASETTTATPLDKPGPTLAWETVGHVPFSMTSGAIVEATEAGIVVVETESTTVIGFDGSTTSGERSPLPIQPGCCGSVVGIPVGGRLVLMDAYRPGTWVLDPGTVTWRPLGDRPTTGDILGTAVIGDDLYLVNSAPRTGVAVSLVLVLDLTTGEWSEGEQVPSGISVGGVTTDGESLIVAGVRQDTNNHIIGESPMPVAYQFGVGGWRRLADIPIHGQASTVVWVDGAGLLAWNYDQESALLPAAGDWQDAGSVPMEFSECYPRTVQTEGGVVGLCGGLAYFDGSSHTWTPIPITSPARYVPVHDSVYRLTPRGGATELAVRALPN